VKRVQRSLPALIWGALFLLGWELLVKVRNIKPFLLAPPSAIGKELWRDLSRMFDEGDSSLPFALKNSFVLSAAKSTATNAFIGLVLGSLVGVLIALVAQRFASVGSTLRPISAAFNTMPIVALGPIFYNLFGATSEGARRIVVALVAFFPVFVNTLKGLTQVDPVHEELMRSYAASDSVFLRLVRLPNALPFAITGLRVAASLSVIAAVVVEYFGGVQNGLGSKVGSAMKQSQTTKAWSYITAAIALGLAFYALGVVLERRVMPWMTRRNAADS
jgi:NitT/TauT family transport system permease protein